MNITLECVNLFPKIGCWNTVFRKGGHLFAKSWRLLYLTRSFQRKRSIGFSRSAQACLQVQCARVCEQIRIGGVAHRSSGFDHASLPAQARHFILSIPIEEAGSLVSPVYRDPGTHGAVICTLTPVVGAFNKVRLTDQEDNGSKWGLWLTVQDS